MGAWQRDTYFAKREAGQLPHWHEPRFRDEHKDGEWEGEDVWIIGGGPSAKQCDLTKLAGRKVITVNMGFTLIEPTIAYFGSILLLLRLEAKHALSDVPRKAALEAMLWNVQHPYGCSVIEVADERAYWGTINGGLPVFSNSGLVAVNLADALGAARIYLVGFDMTGGEDGKTVNFHNEYPESMRPSAGHYDKYLADFRRCIPEHCKAEVFNCSPGSRLDFIPYVPFDALENFQQGHPPVG